MEFRKLIKANENVVLTDKEKLSRIKNAAKHYGKFLESLGYDYLADGQTEETPLRVAKAWMNDLTVGSFSEPPSFKVFPNEDKYEGVVIQTGIRVNSLCAHHNLPFYGWCSIAYLPGEYVIGLSKLNRIVDFYARRPQMQESLTKQIHKYLSEKLECESIAVSISSKHMCCGLRGIRHPESIMTTNEFTGKFMESGNLIREEFLHAISKNGNNF